MQTLKTAAVVVLMMTVIYGIWVPLTTPPEELPPEVAEMMIVSDDLGIDTGLPESLESIAVGQSEPAGELGSQQDTTIPAAQPGPTYGASFADLQPAPGRGTSATLSDRSMSLESSTGIAAVPNKLPDVAAGSAGFAGVPGNKGIPGNGYPSTGNKFDLPDPQAALASFAPETGKQFQPQSGNSNAGATGPVSLSSGTTATDLLTPPGESPQSQTDGGNSSMSDRGNLGLTNAIMTADRQFMGDQKKEALATLSLFYNTPNVTSEQRTELLSRLDPLAREVIYSKAHLLEQPYRVGANETLMEIAERFEVPWQLLANINEIRDPVTVLPGTELKVLRGPFHAQVDLDSQELTLFLGDLYAGRFPIGLGNDPEPRAGTFTVQDKQTSHTYYDPSGEAIPAGSPDNPYGSMWVDLGGRLCIHGSPNTTQPTNRGCISLADDHASDLYGILTQGSLITIRR